MGSSGLGRLLVDEGLLTESDRRTIKDMSGSSASSFARGVIALGILSEEELSRFLVERTHFRLASKDLTGEVTPSASAALDSALIERLGVLPLTLEGGVLTVAVPDPLDQDVIRQLAFFTGYKIKPLVATFSQIDQGLASLVKSYAPKKSYMENFLETHADAAARMLRLKAQMEASQKMRREEAANPRDAEGTGAADTADFTELSFDDQFDFVTDSGTDEAMTFEFIPPESATLDRGNASEAVEEGSELEADPVDTQESFGAGDVESPVKASNVAADDHLDEIEEAPPAASPAVKKTSDVKGDDGSLVFDDIDDIEEEKEDEAKPDASAAQLAAPGGPLAPLTVDIPGTEPLEGSEVSSSLDPLTVTDELLGAEPQELIDNSTSPSTEEVENPFSDLDELDAIETTLESTELMQDLGPDLTQELMSETSQQDAKIFDKTTGVTSAQAASAANFVPQTESKKESPKPFSTNTAQKIAALNHASLDLSLISSPVDSARRLSQAFSDIGIKKGFTIKLTEGNIAFLGMWQDTQESSSKKTNFSQINPSTTLVVQGFAWSKVKDIIWQIPCGEWLPANGMGIRPAKTDETNWGKDPGTHPMILCLETPKQKSVSGSSKIAILCTWPDADLNEPSMLETSLQFIKQFSGRF